MSESYEVSFEAASSTAVVEAVIALGDLNKSTLGFLPYAGYHEAAAKKNIAVALARDGSVAGYCLFELPRDIVRIVHVCIGDDQRGRHLARTLVDAVGERHRDRLGLRLKCRPDWPADAMWPKLDFIAQGQVAGRSKGGHRLTIWWRSHGHADLFTLLDENRAAGRLAAIDSNVYCDLHSATPRRGANYSAVLAPLIADCDLNVAILRTVRSEIYATRDAADKQRYLSAQTFYADAPKVHDPAVLAHLLKSVPVEITAGDPSLERDATLIAQAHANDIDLFITRDNNAIEYLAERAAELGVEVIHPSEVPTLLHRESSARDYEPRQLAETTYSVRRAEPRAFTNVDLDAVLDRPGGERITELRGRLADLASRSSTEVTRTILADADGNTLAAWATESSAYFEVSFLRVAPGPLRTTLARQLSLQLRQLALAAGKPLIRVSDPHRPGEVTAALNADGYLSGENGLTALTLPVVGSWAEVSQAVRSAVQLSDDPSVEPLLTLPEDPSAAQTLELERRWWPAKIIGQGVTSYLVPIRPVFAAALLGSQSTLFNRDDLGLSRELVYYRSNRNQPQPPARILWYVSADKSSKDIGSVVAASRLIEQSVDTPSRLHRRYAHLGVWTLADIDSATGGRTAGALRFVDTELFSRPVRLPDLRAAAGDGRSLSLRSAQRVEDTFFERIYRKGVQR